MLVTSSVHFVLFYTAMFSSKDASTDLFLCDDGEVAGLNEICIIRVIGTIKVSILH